jgi:hypothetical protein
VQTHHDDLHDLNDSAAHSVVKIVVNQVSGAAVQTHHDDLHEPRAAAAERVLPGSVSR